MLLFCSQDFGRLGFHSYSVPKFKKKIFISSMNQLSFNSALFSLMYFLWLLLLLIVSCIPLWSDRMQGAVESSFVSSYVVILTKFSDYREESVFFRVWMECSVDMYLLTSLSCDLTPEVLWLPS